MKKLIVTEIDVPLGAKENGNGLGRGTRPKQWNQFPLDQILRQKRTSDNGFLVSYTATRGLSFLAIGWGAYDEDMP